MEIADEIRKLCCGLIDDDNRRYTSLAWLLRARFLIDVDCFGEVKGQPIKPGTIVRVALDKLAA